MCLNDVGVGDEVGNLRSVDLDDITNFSGELDLLSDLLVGDESSEIGLGGIDNQQTNTIGGGEIGACLESAVSAQIGEAECNSSIAHTEGHRRHGERIKRRTIIASNTNLSVVDAFTLLDWCDGECCCPGSEKSSKGGGNQ